MKAQIFDTVAEAEKVARTMTKLGLEAQVVGSVVVAPAGDFELLHESTMAPKPVLVAAVSL
jgi:hypothetical protein